jgi:tetratricopeptide (TPR) repeat protein
MRCRVPSYPIQIAFLLLATVLPLSALENDSVVNDALKFCISYYRDGYYNRTAECINDALPNITNTNDSLQAFKYLALSYGMINRIDQAESCFRKALEINPGLDIDTLEFPPNIALIYNHVKLEKRIEQIDTMKLKAPAVKAPPPQRSYGLPTTMLTGAILSAGGAGYLFFNGLKARHDYSVERDQTKIDKKWNSFIYSMGGGGVCALACGFFTWMFFSLNSGDSGTAFVVPQTDGIALSFGF